jgi:hypothetical protein
MPGLLTLDITALSLSIVLSSALILTVGGAGVRKPLTLLHPLWSRRRPGHVLAAPPLAWPVRRDNRPPPAGHWASPDGRAAAVHLGTWLGALWPPWIAAARAGRGRSSRFRVTISRLPSPQRSTLLLWRHGRAPSRIVSPVACFLGQARREEPFLVVSAAITFARLVAAAYPSGAHHAITSTLSVGARQGIARRLCYPAGCRGAPSRASGRNSFAVGQTTALLGGRASPAAAP